MSRLRRNSMNRKPRLWMVVHAEYPADVRVARQARAAVAAGYEVRVLALRGAGEPREAIADGVRITRFGTHHRRGGGFLAIVSEYVGFATKAFARLTRGVWRSRPDVIHIHNPPDFLVFAAVVPRLFGVPIVFDIHDLSPDMFAMRFERRRWAKLADSALRLIERLAARMATTVITVHEPYRRELVARGVPSSKTVVVMNSIDESVVPSVEPGREERFRVVYHGTVTPHYGVALVVEAMAGFVPNGKPPLLEIFGVGDAIADIRSRVSALQLDDVVAITEAYLDHSEVLTRVAGASAGVVPNLPTRLNRFALSTKLFEYVTLGIPAVCADLPTLREYFSPDEVTFFKAGDPDSLREALATVAADPEHAHERAAAARRRALNYSWHENRERYLAILAAVLDGAPPPTAELPRR